MRSRSLAVVLIFSTVASVFGHHGKDFLLAESYEIPHPGDLYFASSFAVTQADGATEFELEPSVLFGVLPRLAFELHAHAGREEHDRLRYEATAPAFHFQITPPESNFPVRVGLSGEYEFAAASDAHDRAELRLILERDIGRSRFVVNLSAEHEFSGETGAGYAAGYRYEITERIACGVEAQGAFTEDARHDLIAAIYGEPDDRITLKAGVGVGISRNDVGLAIRTGVVFRF